MTLTKLQELSRKSTNKNFASAYKELYNKCTNNSFICEEALISEKAEALLEYYLPIAQKTKNTEMSQKCIALQKAKVHYKTDKQVSDALLEIVSDDKTDEQIKNIYKNSDKARFTKLSTFNTALKLLRPENGNV